MGFALRVNEVPLFSANDNSIIENNSIKWTSTNIRSRGDLHQIIKVNFSSMLMSINSIAKVLSEKEAISLPQLEVINKAVQKCCKSINVVNQSELPKHYPLNISRLKVEFGEILDILEGGIKQIDTDVVTVQALEHLYRKALKEMNNLVEINE